MSNTFWDDSNKSFTKITRLKFEYPNLDNYFYVILSPGEDN